MDSRLQEIAESRYHQQQFLATLLELAVEQQWFDVRHMVQHDMAKAILSDYSSEIGRGDMHMPTYYENWEEVVAVGWKAFCDHTGLSQEKLEQHLQALGDHA
ncbi:MAG: hypothetical protein K2Y22_15715 [Candidatus Obscuribacterales bacterium]|nr:hypothetical protein [Candidatus Obscuribacterales bacterium]